jgi:hypothetical protein
MSNHHYKSTAEVNEAIMHKIIKLLEASEKNPNVNDFYFRQLPNFGEKAEKAYALHKHLATRSKMENDYRYIRGKMRAINEERAKLGNGRRRKPVRRSSR